MSCNRRSFLAATAGGAGLVAAAVGKATAASPPTPDPAPEAPPMALTRADLPTPALLLDLDRFEANVKTLADFARGAGRGVRPHAKTHKCPEIARRQVAAGALGISVATVPEAEAMAGAGINGLLLTSPILDPRKVARMVALARSGVGVMLAVGSTDEARLLEEAASAAGLVLDVLLDLDVGDGRFGIPPGDEAYALGRSMAGSRHLKFRGIQAYSGGSSHVEGWEARARHSREAMGRAVAMRRRLEVEGIAVEILSGGSSGTYNIDGTLEGVTELQAGSYVFMDVGYRKIGGKDGGATYTDFQPSLTVLTTVVSASVPGRATCDAGIKAFATDSADVPEAVGRPGLHYKRFGDEFGLLTADPGVDLPSLGERLEFLVPHCDPTVNLYDRIHALRGDVVEATWPIVARRDPAG